MLWMLSVVSFFFQAEDGIRDPLVTGVQTCALPISLGQQAYGEVQAPRLRDREQSADHADRAGGRVRQLSALQRRVPPHLRSEERRVGKSVDLGGRRIMRKKGGCGE